MSNTTCGFGKSCHTHHVGLGASSSTWEIPRGHMKPQLFIKSHDYSVYIAQSRQSPPTVRAVSCRKRTAKLCGLAAAVEALVMHMPPNRRQPASSCRLCRRESLLPTVDSWTPPPSLAYPYIDAHCLFAARSVKALSQTALSSGRPPPVCCCLGLLRTKYLVGLGLSRPPYRLAFPGFLGHPIARQRQHNICMRC